MIKIHDMTTDEVIEREMNAEELAQLKKDQAEAKAKAAAELAKATEKTALLTQLGITSDQAKLLLS